MPSALSWTGTKISRMGARNRILVVRLASLGDLLITTPALRALRVSFRDAHIGVLTTPGSAAALRGLDSYDEIISFDKFAFDRPSDALTSLPVGLDNGRGRWFLTDSAVDRGFGWHHEVDYCLDVVGVLGARHPNKPRLEMCIAPDDDGWAAARWSESQLREAVLLVPGSGAFSRARRWAPERFVEVGHALLAQYGLTPLVLSGLDPDEQALARHVAAQ